MQVGLVGLFRERSDSFADDSFYVGYRWCRAPWRELNDARVKKTWMPFLVGLLSIYFSRLIDQIIPSSFQKYF